MTMTDKILTRIMIGAVIAMSITTVLGLCVVGFDKVNEPVPFWMDAPMMVMGAVFLIALFWMVIVWAGTSQKPVNPTENQPNKK